MDTKNKTISLSEHHRCQSVEIMVVSSELNQWKQEMYTISYIGESLSIFGFSLLLLTAYIFPSWRKKDQTNAWIQLCFAYLIFTILYVTFKDFDYCTAPGVLFLMIYFGQATFCWMFAVSWLAYKRLGVVFSKDGGGFIWRASLFSWLSPLPCDFLRLALDVTEFPDIMFHKKLARAYIKIGRFAPSLGNVVKFIDLLRDVGMYLPVIVPIIGSVVTYGYVMTLLFKNRREWGNNQDVYGTAAISILFILMSGVQFMFVVFSRFYTFTRVDLLLALIITSKVFVNSVLFLVAIKKTRLMWLAYLRLKFDEMNCRVRIFGTRNTNS